MGRFSKSTIAKDIEKYLKKKKLIPRKYKVVIPKGGYNYEEDEIGRIWCSGNFEVFRTPNDIDSYGKFQAMVPEVLLNEGKYNLIIWYRGKEYIIYNIYG
jgi:hypothetical protein